MTASAIARSWREPIHWLRTKRATARELTMISSQKIVARGSTEMVDLSGITGDAASATRQAGAANAACGKSEAEAQARKRPARIHTFQSRVCAGGKATSTSPATKRKIPRLPCSRPPARRMAAKAPRKRQSTAARDFWRRLQSTTSTRPAPPVEAISRRGES